MEVGAASVSSSGSVARVLRGRSGSALLLAGALVGVLLAATGVVERSGSSELALGDEVVATVNGVPIRRPDYDRALAAVATDRRDGRVDNVMREHVLDRLIDEELLLQRGLELGLARSVPNLRTNLSTAVIDLITARDGAQAGETAQPATDDELREYYRANAAYFRHSPRIHVETLFFAAGGHRDDAAALARADDARRRLVDGEIFRDVSESADRQIVQVPDGALPLPKLREYLGPTVTRGVAGLAKGEISEPLRAGSGYFVARVVGREEGALPPFDSIHEQVRSEYERRSSERRLREFLDKRRNQANVRIAASSS